MSDKRPVVDGGEPIDPRERTKVVNDGRAPGKWEIEKDRAKRGETTAPPGGGVIGTRARKVDGFLKATGRAVYTDDISLPGMLHGKILRSKYAHARLRGIDV